MRNVVRMLYISDTPFGALPILEFDGLALAQSLAIARYLAREFGLAGKSRFEEALVDSVVDTSNDILGTVYSSLHHKKVNSVNF